MKALSYSAIFIALLPAPFTWANESGVHQSLLLKALAANATGKCPEILMGPVIKRDCDRQLPVFKETLVKLGSINDASLQGMRTIESGPAEVYKVSFEHGEMTWIINTQEDGRILVLWAPNEPTWDFGSFSRKSDSAGERLWEPTGATAECADGTFYHEAPKQGACFGNGGVRKWSVRADR